MLQQRVERYLFESPIGYVECMIRGETIISSTPASVAPASLLHTAKRLYPLLAQAFLSISVAPAPYRLLLDSPGWAPTFWEVLASIKFGTTLTYAQLANKLGLGNGYARAIGKVLSTNNHYLLLPCHRIIKSDGTIGGFRWGSELKRAILTYENHGKAN